MTKIYQLHPNEIDFQAKPLALVVEEWNVARACGKSYQYALQKQLERQGVEIPTNV